MSPQAKAGAAGAVLAVLAWAAWSALDSGTPADPAASLVAAGASSDNAPVVATAPAPIDTPHPDSPIAPAVAVTPPSAAASQPAPPVLRDGFVMQHGVLTAERSPVDPNSAQQAQTAPAVPVALPEGVRPEDAVVSVAGVVAVVRTNGSVAAAQPPLAANDPAIASLRAAAVTHAP